LLNQATSLTFLRNLVWAALNFCRGKPQPPFDLVSPLLPCIARLLYHADEEVLTDACWALLYLGDGPNDRIQAVLESGCARRLVELITHSNRNIIVPALRTIGNIVTGDDMQTQVILNCNVLAGLKVLLSHTFKAILKEACWTLSNITAGNRTQIQAVIDARIIPLLIEKLSGVAEVSKEAAWALSNATSGGTLEQIEHLVAEGVVGPMCDLFCSADIRIVQVALEAIGNILHVGQLPDGTSRFYSKFSQRNIEDIGALVDHQNVEVSEKAAQIIELLVPPDPDAQVRVVACL
jgi:importin subunit alpha-1